MMRRFASKLRAVAVKCFHKESSAHGAILGKMLASQQGCWREKIVGQLSVSALGRHVPYQNASASMRSTQHHLMQIWSVRVVLL